MIRAIQCHFSEQAPMIKIKSSNSSKPNLSNETNNIIKKKDSSYKEMKSNPTTENKNNFKMLSIMARKGIIKDKNKELNKNIQAN